jgi:cell division protein ZipA
MSDLRLIILAVGLLLVGAIYFFEVGRNRKKLRKQQRRDTVSLQDQESTADAPMIHIRKEPEHTDLSLALSELNETLAENRRQDEQIASELLSDASNRQDFSEGVSIYNENQESQDLFSESEDQLKSNRNASSFADDYKNIGEEQVISLYVMSSPDNPFSGGAILDAVNEVGLEYGEMQIFHHFGIGEVPLDRPIFSMADMFKPGSFDLDSIESHQTKGLSLFMCLPLPIDGLIVFELMLNTSERLAEILGGDIRGGDHQILNDDHINNIRKAITQ